MDNKQVTNVVIFAFMILWGVIAMVAALASLSSINNKSKEVNYEWESMVASYDSRMALLVEASKIEAIKRSNPSFVSSVNDLEIAVSKLKIDPENYDVTEADHVRRYDELQKDLSALSRSFVLWMGQNPEIGKIEEVVELKDKILKWESSASIDRTHLIEKISAYNKAVNENKSLQKRHGFKTKPDFSSGT